MVAPLGVLAGLAGRYGVKKVAKDLATKAQRKAAKEQIKSAREIAKDKGNTPKSLMDKFNKKLDKAAEQVRKADKAKSDTKIKNAPNARVKKKEMKKAEAKGFKKGGMVKKCCDGIAKRGKTRGRMV